MWPTKQIKIRGSEWFSSSCPFSPQSVLPPITTLSPAKPHWPFPCGRKLYLPLMGKAGGWREETGLRAFPSVSLRPPLPPPPTLSFSFHPPPCQVLASRSPGAKATGLHGRLRCWNNDEERFCSLICQPFWEPHAVLTFTEAEASVFPASSPWPSSGSGPWLKTHVLGSSVSHLQPQPWDRTVIHGGPTWLEQPLQNGVDRRPWDSGTGAPGPFHLHKSNRANQTVCKGEVMDMRGWLLCLVLGLLQHLTSVG